MDEDEKLLNKFGWIVECISPFEIRNDETESFATNEAAYCVLDRIKELNKLDEN